MEKYLAGQWKNTLTTFRKDMTIAGILNLLSDRGP
jgi:hypothetical protein